MSVTSVTTKHVNNKAIKVFHYWFCSKCLQQVTVPSLYLDIPFEDPNEFSFFLERGGFKLSCKTCGNTTFIKKDFEVPIEDIVEKELAKQVKKYLNNNIDPTRRI